MLTPLLLEGLAGALVLPALPPLLPRLHPPVRLELLSAELLLLLLLLP